MLIAAIYHWDEFDEPMDGVVYGVAVALGFATLENFLFVTRLGLGVAWLRALFAVPAHALFGATMGYYAGRTKFDRGRRARVGPAALSRRPGRVSRPVTTTRSTTASAARVWIVISLLSVGLWTSFYVASTALSARHLFARLPRA